MTPSSDLTRARDVLILPKDWRKSRRNRLLHAAAKRVGMKIEVLRETYAGAKVTGVWIDECPWPTNTPAKRNRKPVVARKRIGNG